jgi:hypothetical protein
LVAEVALKPACEYCPSRVSVVSTVAPVKTVSVPLALAPEASCDQDRWMLLWQKIEAAAGGRAIADEGGYTDTIVLIQVFISSRASRHLKPHGRPAGSTGLQCCRTADFLSAGAPVKSRRLNMLLLAIEAKLQRF